MDKKKEKNMKKIKLQPNSAGLESSRIIGCIPGKFRECVCNCEGRKQDDLTSKKSAIRITGRLALSRDDDLTEADFNDKRVATESIEWKNSELMQRWEGRSHKQDFNNQTDIQNENKYELQVSMMKTNGMISKETQTTQLDFDVILSSERDKNRKRLANKEEMIQCHCTDMGYDNKALPYMGGYKSYSTNSEKFNNSCKDGMIQTYCTNMESFKNILHFKKEMIKSRSNNTETNNFGKEGDIKPVKESQNPILVISVYPGPDCSDVTISENQKTSKNVQQLRKTLPNQTQRLFTANSAVREKKSDGKVVRASRSPSPDKIQNRNLKTRETIRSRKTSPERKASPDRQIKLIKDGNNKTVSSPKNRIRNKISPQKRTKDAKGTNTDHGITKKAIVENYTERITAFMENTDVERKYRPKNDSSRITVNIDGDDEHYALLFQQDDLTTDFKVRKTLKGPQNRNVGARSISATRKILTGSDELRRKPHTLSKNEKSKDSPSKVPFRARDLRLQARDSLEISHRYEAKDSVAKVKNKSRKKSL